MSFPAPNPPPPVAARGRGQRAAFPRTRRMADGRTEKRFPCCAGRDCFPPPLARAFGEFAPRADSGLREAGRADADGGEPESANRAKIAPGRLGMSGGDNPPPFSLAPRLPPKFAEFGRISGRSPPRTFPPREFPPPDLAECDKIAV